MRTYLDGVVGFFILRGLWLVFFGLLLCMDDRVLGEQETGDEEIDLAYVMILWIGCQLLTWIWVMIAI